MKLSIFAVFFVASTLVAQQPTQETPSSPAPAGQVSGRIICGDTGQPGRFATVQLIAEKPQQMGAADFLGLDKNPDLGKSFGTVFSAMLKGGNTSAVANLDGNYSLEKVPAGVYYVIAQMPGYLSPLNQFSAAERIKADPATLKAVEALAEKIAVQPGQTSHVDFHLERGAGVSGTVHYDDGSPVAGATPTLLLQGTDGKWKQLAISLMPVTTDDRGHFRFFGLPAGKYAVSAPLPNNQVSMGLGMASMGVHINPADSLVAYSGGVLREKDVKPIEVGDGADVDGVEVIFPLNGLHTISGTVTANSTRHPVNRGAVTLLDPDTKAVFRTGMLEADGSFRLNYVPEGSYMVKIVGAADTDRPEGASSMDFAQLAKARVLKSYGDAERSIIVQNDMNDLNLQVPDTPAKAQTDN